MPTNGSDYYNRGLDVKVVECKHPMGEREIWSFNGDNTKSGQCEHKEICRACGKIIQKLGHCIQPTPESVKLILQT